MIRRLVLVLLVLVGLPLFAGKPFASYSSSSNDKALYAKLKSFDYAHPSVESIKEIADLRKHVSEDISDLVAEFCAGAAIVAEKTTPGTVDEIRPMLGGRTKIDEACYIKCKECGGHGFVERKCGWCKGKPYCDACKGKGTIEIKKLSGETKKTKCASCGGTGACPKCGGTQVERSDCLKCGKRGTYWDYKKAQAGISAISARLFSFLNVSAMADDVALSLVTVKGSLFEGTGTLVDFNGGKYVVTDSALLIAAHNIKLIGPDGFEISFSEIKLAADRELAIFKIPENTEGVFLKFADKQPLTGAWLWPFAHCGASVLSRMITVKPKDTISLSTEYAFDGVSCGAPVLNIDKKVAGIIGATLCYPVSSSPSVLAGCNEYLVRTDNIAPGLFSLFEREKNRGILRELANATGEIAECSNIVMSAWDMVNAEGKAPSLERQFEQLEKEKKILSKSSDWPLPQIGDFVAKLSSTCSVVEDMIEKVADKAEEAKVAAEKAAAEEAEKARKEAEKAYKQAHPEEEPEKTPLPSERNPWIMRGIYIAGGLILLAILYSVAYSLIEKIKIARRPKWQPPAPLHVQAYKKPDKIPFHKKSE